MHLRTTLLCCLCLLLECSWKVHAAHAQESGAAQPLPELPTLPETLVEAEAPNDTPITPGFDPLGPNSPVGSPYSRSEDLLGETESASQGIFGQPDLEHRPIARPGEVLELVPGLIATQHSGSGKANQFFVRGMNLDHGTDFAVKLGGVPLNLPTHAHGQGYLDVNWLIPELIEVAEYKLGTYYADVGDFSSAGSLALDYYRKLPHSIAQVSGGQFNYYRLLVADQSELAGGNLMYVYESVFYDGPWVKPENYSKYNGVLRWTTGDDTRGMSLSALGYRASWNATNQIPLMAVEDGLVGRFGSLDPSDGGNTSRVTANAEFWDNDADVQTKAGAYVCYYQLDLFSNFTYFLDDQVNGDQIEQKDGRVYSGAYISRQWENDVTSHTVGFQFRNDSIYELELNHTTKRNFLNTNGNDDVDQQNYGLYYINETPWTDMFRSYGGLRGDFFRFHTQSNDMPIDSGTTDAAIFSPKVGLVFGPAYGSELYLNWGQSFHSNDARGINSAVDPAQPLVKSDGSEVGTRSNVTDTWTNTMALWYLKLDSELLFVGDEGTTEPTGASHRAGFTTTNTWKATDWLTLEGDYSYVKPRYFGGERIPGAVNNVLSTGFAMRRPDSPYYMTFRVRHFGPAALVEDNSARSSTTTVANVQVGRETENLRIAVDFFNMFGRADNDVVYYYESRPTPGGMAVNDYHFHPIEPFSVRGHLTWKF